MAILNHTLGFPRVGPRRELKKAQEGYWAGNLTQAEPLEVGKSLRARHWQQQKDAGVDLLPVGDFAWYDHVLTSYWVTCLHVTKMQMARLISTRCSALVVAAHRPVSRRRPQR